MRRLRLRLGSFILGSQSRPPHTAASGLHGQRRLSVDFDLRWRFPLPHQPWPFLALSYVPALLVLHFIHTFQLAIADRRQAADLDRFPLGGKSRRHGH